MRLLACLIVLLVVPVPVAAQEDGSRLLHKLEVAARSAVIVSAAVDYGLTVECLNTVPTCREANPAVKWADRNTVTLGLVKMGYTAGLIAATEYFGREHPHDTASDRNRKRLVKIGAYAVQVAVNGLVIAHARRVINEGRR